MSRKALRFLAKSGARVKRFTQAPAFRPLPQQGLGPLGVRATMGMGSRHAHACDDLEGGFYKIIGNQWKSYYENQKQFKTNRNGSSQRKVKQKQRKLK